MEEKRHTYIIVERVEMESRAWVECETLKVQSCLFWPFLKEGESYWWRCRQICSFGRLETECPSGSTSLKECFHLRMVAKEHVGSLEKCIEVCKQLGKKSYISSAYFPVEHFVVSLSE